MDPITRTPTEARQASEEGVVQTMLGWSLGLAIAGMAAALFLVGCQAPADGSAAMASDHSAQQSTSGTRTAAQPLAMPTGVSGY